MSHKGYKCMSKDKRVYISRDVIFNEHCFPYTKSQKHTTTPNIHVPTSGLPPVSSLLQPTASPSSNTGDSPSPFNHPAAVSDSRPAATNPHIGHLVDVPILTTTNLPPLDTITNVNVTIAPVPTDIATVGTPNPTQSATAASTHPMVTRLKAGIRKPKALLAHCEPRSNKAALQMPQWNGAITHEFKALIRNNTWILVRLPPNRKPIGCKWILRIKHNADGSLDKFKARLVAKDFHQQAEFDFEETFSPVVKPITIRVVLTIAITKGWSIRQLDVNNAFLNGDLQEEIYMQQPPGFVSQEHPDYVCKLNKAIYGLKQAPRAWFEKLSTALISMGFHSSQADNSLFIQANNMTCIYILIYVDDILIMGNNDEAVNKAITGLSTKFALKDLGILNYFLGIQVTKTDHGLLLSQTKYLQDLLSKGDMQNVNTQNTPMNSGLKLSNYGSEPMEDVTLYRSIFGALQYATITRPELTFSVNKVCQFMHAPLQQHWMVMKHILRYIAGTLDYGLHLKTATDFSIEAFCDADWAADLDH
uniref:Reverse transcriptase Ty1/copia-type domain-containing protein n=1 Tax=Cannabis sativa TaxID=3483 RepID=A0A803Q2E8_CANSA